MQFTKSLREPVRQGKVTVSVRVWKRPRVRVGGRYRMDGGSIVVESMSQISLADITPTLARQCGFAGVVDLLKVARHGTGQNIYLIRFRYEQTKTATDNSDTADTSLSAALKSEAEDWNGRSAEGLTQLFSSFSGSHGFVSTLLRWGMKPGRSNGTTWLLKRYVETGGHLSQAQTRAVLRTVTELTDWPSVLHLLQTLPYLQIPEELKRPTHGWVEANLNHNNKMVRAWALNGIHVMASQFPEFQQPALHLLNQALEAEAPSVRARARACLKSGF